MGKRILLISYYFGPQNAMGAVRPTKLAKYLSRMGHEVTVICGVGMGGKTDPTLKRDLQTLTDVHVVREWSLLRYLRKHKSLAQGKGTSNAEVIKGAGNSPKSTVKKAVLRIADAAYVAQFWWTDVSFRRLACRELRKLSGTYDMVFSTYAPMSVHEIACKAKRMGLAKRWVADFRDEVGVWFRFQEGRKRRYMQMIRNEADMISAVSSGFLEMMDFETTGKVLSNGFDREDIPQGVPSAANDGKLHVVYCGQMQDSRHGVGGRDITPMFASLAKLIDEKQLQKNELELVYAGREGGLFCEYASRCGLEECVVDHGQVSRDRSIALQQQADILLMASIHTSEQKGILTGKLFEYMMMDKPIVCCMSGDLKDSGVKQVLSQTGLGLCVEQAAGAADEQALLGYVRALVERWRAGEKLLQHQSEEAVESYHYPVLARKLAEWMEE